MKAKATIRWMIILAILGGMISACNLPVVGPSPEEVQAAADALTSKDPTQATETDIQSALDLASQAQALGLDQTAQDLLDWAREALTSMAAGLLGKEPCEATLDDVRQAIQLAGEAQKVPGMEATADQLMDWAREGFQSYAARRAASGADAKERTKLAVEAQKIPGLDQLAEDLMAGKAIASLCEEEWRGTLELSDGISGPNLELIGITHVEFTFKVDRQGRVQGSGRGKYTLVKYVVYPVPGILCPGTVEMPDFDVTVSGAKGDQTFDLKWEGTTESTMTVPPCYWGDGGYFSMGPITGKTPFTFAYAIAAQEGTYSCGTGCTVEIRKR